LTEGKDVGALYEQRPVLRIERLEGGPVDLRGIRLELPEICDAVDAFDLQQICGEPPPRTSDRLLPRLAHS
jgi:hypothetical protein